jgi:hypothetical protein
MGLNLVANQFGPSGVPVDFPSAAQLANRGGPIGPSGVHSPSKEDPAQ